MKQVIAKKSEASPNFVLLLHHREILFLIFFFNCRKPLFTGHIIQFFLFTVFDSFLFGAL